jgi:hypothetical protein
MKNARTEPESSEHAIQRSILTYLAIDRRIAWYQRFNTGAIRLESRNAEGKPSRRFVRFAFPGCSDILGQLVTGHLLAIEVKRPRTGPTDEQAAFLAQVNRAGGLGLIACAVEDVKAALDRFAPLQQQSAA